MFYIHFRAVKCRPCIYAVVSFARDYVNMKVGHRLSCAFIACIEQIHAIISTIIYAVI